MKLQQDKGLLSSVQKNLLVSPTLPLYWEYKFIYEFYYNLRHFCSKFYY